MGSVARFTRALLAKPIAIDEEQVKKILAKSGMRKALTRNFRDISDI